MVELESFRKLVELTRNDPSMILPVALLSLLCNAAELSSTVVNLSEFCSNYIDG